MKEDKSPKLNATMVIWVARDTTVLGSIAALHSITALPLLPGYFSSIFLVAQASVRVHSGNHHTQPRKRQ